MLVTNGGRKGGEQRPFFPGHFCIIRNIAGKNWSTISITHNDKLDSFHAVGNLDSKEVMSVQDILMLLFLSFPPWGGGERKMKSEYSL